MKCPFVSRQVDASCARKSHQRNIFPVRFGWRQMLRVFSGPRLHFEAQSIHAISNPQESKSIWTHAWDLFFAPVSNLKTIRLHGRGTNLWSIIWAANAHLPASRQTRLPISLWGTISRGPVRNPARQEQWHH